MSMQLNNTFTLFLIISISILFLGQIRYPNFVNAQNNYNTDNPNNPKNIIIKYCEQFAHSVARGMDVVQDLIGAGVVPSSYYDKTCQDEINGQ